VPFAAAPLGYIREFIPAYAAAMFVISAITSALLFVQFSVVRSRALLVVSAGVAGVLLTVDLVAWLATAVSDSTPGDLPFSILDRSQLYWNALFLLLALFALALLWSKRRSVLDLWLMGVMCGLVIELCLITLVGRRYVVGWYAARVYFLISSTLVLAVLLSETALLYARLARSVMAQRREREARLMTLDVLSASIAHEMRQPLASIVTNVDAASRWMERPTPDLDEVKATLEQIRNSAYRARDRAMVKKDGRNRAALNLNDLVYEVLALMKGELQRNRISVELELDEHLPVTKGDRTQLQQVLTNLITNAIDAMTEKKGSRILRIKSAIQDPAGVLISVADTGKGIDPKITDRIFNPLFTTKSNGMGMGLAICRSIIEAHDGRLWASAGAQGGSVFQFVLPANIAS
jgi:signal transduction histidine kinase